jgi:hypothetical protein
LPAFSISELKDRQSSAVKGVVYGLLITKDCAISTCSSISIRIDPPDKHVVPIILATSIVTLLGLMENSNRAVWIHEVGGREYGLKRQGLSKENRTVFKAFDV